MLWSNGSEYGLGSLQCQLKPGRSPRQPVTHPQSQRSTPSVASPKAELSTEVGLVVQSRNLSCLGNLGKGRQGIVSSGLVWTA